jgi:ubiquinol-cytochrome c reductase cytochrome b subunit
MLKKEEMRAFLGETCLAMMVISVLSGTIITFHYDYHMPYKTTQFITYAVPFGWFLRRLHYWSSEFFLIFLILHTFWHLYFDYKKHSFFTWLIVTLSVPATLFVMFTGFILKGDLEGLSALLIMKNTLLSIPFFGSYIIPFFINTQDKYYLPFLYHCFIIPLFLLFSTFIHLKRIFSKSLYTLYSCVLCLLVAIFFPLFPSFPPFSTAQALKGPWFFWGIQEAYEFLSPFMAGIVMPFVFFFLLFSLPLLKDEKPIRFIFSVSVFVYCLLSIYFIIVT